MENLLHNKKIVIMGVLNKRSIAWGCAESMKKFGAQIIYTYQNERMGAQLKKITASDDILIQCDVSSDTEIERAFSFIGENVGNIDGVVHSIAYADKGDLEGNFSNTSREGFILAHDISAYSFVAVSKYAAAIMNEGGSLVTLTYIGSQKAIPNYNVMGVAKASLEASVRYLAKELAQKKIRVNGISAGVIKTLAASGVKDFNKLLQLSIERTPSGAPVTVEEVGNAATFLVSDLATGVTGDILYVDNGFHLS